MPDLLIRPARPDDAATLYRFLCDLEETTLDPTAFRAVYRHNLADPWLHYLVAEAGDELVGCVSCHVQYLLHHTGKVAEIQELFVADAWRNRHVGRQLVAALEALGRREQWVTLEVTSNRRRTHAHRFYEQLGFAASHVKFVKTL
jgi:(aminoalkyl)phosphonate N-acetyltransferase